jgi:hypothetical protein
MDRAEQELFERSVRAAVERADDGALDPALERLGWRDALTADPAAAIGTLFEQQGRANATSSALDDVLAFGLGLAGGELAPAAVILPPVGRRNPPGRCGARLTVRGIGTRRTATSDTVIVCAAAALGPATTVCVPAAALDLRPIAGIDPAFGLLEVTGSVDHEPGPPVDWDGAVAWGQLAVGYELVGASRTMLELARQHALDRQQFDRPIAGFQAVRHRLADTLVAVEAASAALAAATEGWPAAGATGAAGAGMAKAMAGRAAKTAARHCQQVLAGIGFTNEHPFHRYLRRTVALDQLLGSSATLTVELGLELWQTRRLPPLPAL